MGSCFQYLPGHRLSPSTQIPYTLSGLAIGHFPLMYTLLLHVTVADVSRVRTNDAPHLTVRTETVSHVNGNEAPRNLHSDLMILG